MIQTGTYTLLSALTHWSDSNDPTAASNKINKVMLTHKVLPTWLPEGGKLLVRQVEQVSIGANEFTCGFFFICLFFILCIYFLVYLCFIYYFFLGGGIMFVYLYLYVHEFGDFFFFFLL